MARGARRSEMWTAQPRRLVAKDGARRRALRGTIFVAVCKKKPFFGTSVVPARAICAALLRIFMFSVFDNSKLILDKAS
eukprot:941729-Pleurochrysis_carterae.AAC.2